ncbi:methyltransferase [Sphingobium algorifonticola]|uniref:Methyltransferase domain-containing protein n=1 Tax=Sphingobium algorifonticola TaxID=2008318 RepID=A0A437J5V3_9SPHN|nr:methyltransferase [Sphingobium algorifonticola]RVT40231.1 methyltransferase domain-containing protein [Sphingobium algorifonticola]
MNWQERWTGWRNRILSDPGFQHWAARLWMTRPVARMRARRIFDLVAGFAYSQVLDACIRSRLLDRLAEGPMTSRAVAAATDLPEAGAERLLRAAAALRLTERLDDGRWTLGSDGAALRGNGGIADMVAHHHLLYADLADPLALLRRGGGGGALARYWHYAEDVGQGDGDQVAPYSALMAASQPLIAKQVIDAYRFSRHRRMLDVGGGQGAFLCAVAAAAPALELALFDLPAVGVRARQACDSAGCGDRVTIHGGSFLADPLPQGYDLITLVRVLHDHDDDPAMFLLRSIHAALPPAGRLLLAEPMARTRGAEPAGDAYFGLYLLAMGSGRPRSFEEIAGMAKAVGFRRIRRIRTAMPLTTSILLAER